MDGLNLLLNLSEDIAVRLDNLPTDGFVSDTDHNEYEHIRKLAWKMAHEVSKLSKKTD